MHKSETPNEIYWQLIVFLWCRYCLYKYCWENKGKCQKFGPEWLVSGWKASQKSVQLTIWTGKTSADLFEKIYEFLREI